MFDLSAGKISQKDKTEMDGRFAQTIAGRYTEEENYTEELFGLLLAVLAEKNAQGMFVMTRRNGHVEQIAKGQKCGSQSIGLKDQGKQKSDGKQIKVENGERTQRITNG